MQTYGFELLSHLTMLIKRNSIINHFNMDYDYIKEILSIPFTNISKSVKKKITNF